MWDVAHLLIECGADISPHGMHGETPLHLALRSGYVEVADVLIERGADVSAQGLSGETPLHLALRLGHVEVAHLLVERGADVSAHRNFTELIPQHESTSSADILTTVQCLPPPHCS